MKIIALVGFMGSGKDTAADYLVSNGFTRLAFADSLKDAVAAIFRWDRDLLDGKTKDSRLWREQIDPWWASKLGVPGLTPRWVLQNFGTEVIRTHFHPDIWMLNTEKRIHDMGANAKIVITDCRFGNEITFVNKMGGKVVRIKRGDDPIWFDTALLVNVGIPLSEEDALRINAASVAMKSVYKVHESEWAWIGSAQYTIDNDDSLEDLYRSMMAFVL